MRLSEIAVALILAAGVAVPAPAQGNAPAAPPRDTSLFPNDFGPSEIDVSEYPKDKREAYRLMTFKCAACHTVARPINAQYLELTPEELAQAKKDDPDLLKDDKIVTVDDKIWARYVKRMMAKPGCPVKAEDGKKIYEFLVFDAKLRKMGAHAKEWRDQRGKLVGDFKEKHPDAYAKLFGPNDPKAGK